MTTSLVASEGGAVTATEPCGCGVTVTGANAEGTLPTPGTLVLPDGSVAVAVSFSPGVNGSGEATE